MSDTKGFSIINLNDLTWFLNVAIMGGTFAIFCLIYNDYYIYYGLITFIFGIVSHSAYKFFGWFFENKGGENNRLYWTWYLSLTILIVIWIRLMVCIYY